MRAETASGQLAAKARRKEASLLGLCRRGSACLRALSCTLHNKGGHSTAPLTSDGGAEQERSSAALGSV